MIRATVKSIDNRGYANLHTASVVELEHVTGEPDEHRRRWFEQPKNGYHTLYGPTNFTPGDRVTVYYGETCDGGGWYLRHVGS